MRGVRVALAAGLALTGLALALTLTRAPLSVARANRPRGHSEETIASTTHGTSYCQGREVLPRGTTAIRIWLDAAAGPRTRVVVSSHGRPVTSGQRGSDWTGGSVTVPVKPPARTVSAVTVCVSFPLHDETVVAQGNAAPAALAAHEGPLAIPGRIWIEYLRPGKRSWASLAPQVARHIGLGRAAAGSWIAALALALFAAVVALSSNLLVKEMP